MDIEELEYLIGLCDIMLMDDQTFITDTPWQKGIFVSMRLQPFVYMGSRSVIRPL
jgi:hypothetical protein